MNFMDLSLTNLCKEFKRRQQIREGYADDDAAVGAVIGISGAILAIILVISLSLWIWGLVVTLKYWKMLPNWAQIFAVLGLIPGLPFGPVVTLIVVYVGKVKR